MKHFLVSILLVMASSNLIRAQSSFHTAAGASGLLMRGKYNLDFSYALDANRFGLAWHPHGKADGVTESGSAYELDHYGAVIDGGITVGQDTKSIFSAGTFDPGWDASLTAYIGVGHTGIGDITAAVKYRIIDQTILTIAQRSADSLQPSSLQSISHEGRLTISFGPDNNTNIAISGQIGYSYNSNAGLKKRSVSQLLASGKDSVGDALEVSKNTDRYFGSVKDRATGELRVDFCRNLGGLSDAAEPPTFGILAALSAKKFENIKWSGNISAGFGFFKPNEPNAMVVAVMGELIDWNNALTPEQTLNQSFDIKVYLGYPF